METIRFQYNFSDKGHDNDNKSVELSKESESGLTCGTICEMFLDFMDSCGYCEQNIFDYFKE